jgi:hypothetical protein
VRAASSAEQLSRERPELTVPEQVRGDASLAHALPDCIHAAKGGGSAHQIGLLGP